MMLSILQYGDPILRAKGARVDKIDNRIRELAADMLETMHAANGVGLAAQQIGEALQLTVIDVSPQEERPSALRMNNEDVDLAAAMPIILVNPEITLNKETEIGSEGCLSFPEITGDIERAHSISVRAQNLEGEAIEFEASGLLARAVQHEIDHLDGILFIDRMNSATKVSLEGRLKRMHKETQRGGGQDRQAASAQSAL